MKAVDIVAREVYPDKKRLKIAQQKVQEYYDKYGEFEAYNALSGDTEEDYARPDGSIDWDKVHAAWISYYYQNPDAPV